MASRFVISCHALSHFVISHQDASFYVTIRHFLSHFVIFHRDASFLRHILSSLVTFRNFLSHLVISCHIMSFFVTFHYYFVTFSHFSSFGSACCCCCCSTTLPEWKGINCKQSTRWQHLSQLTASAFFSLRKNFSCYEAQQLILWTGTAIWWVTEPH
jgi:hypothetical protein